MTAPSIALTLQPLGDMLALKPIPPARLPERVCACDGREEKDQQETVL